MPSKDPKNNTFKTIARFSGIGVQMGVTIYLGAWFGRWLDEKYPMEKTWFTIGCTLLAVVIALYSVLQQVNKYNDND